MIPTDISNCIAWYDPQKTKTLATSPVTKTFNLSYTQQATNSKRFCTSIPDLSGAGNTLTEISAGNGVGHAPKWSNFRHCFYNTETTKAMVSPIYNNAAKNYTWVFVFQTGATLGTDALMGAQDATGRRMYVDLQANGSIIFGMGSTAQTVTGLLSTNTYYFLVVSWSNTTGQITASLNGTAITFTNPAYTASGVSTVPIHFFCRSNNGTPTNYTNNVGVGDVLCYEKILSATEILQLQRYMERRWKKSLIFITIDSGGQSQEQGRTTVANWPGVPEYQGDTAADAHDHRVLQYGRVAGTDDGQIILGTQSFDHWDMSANNDVGPLLNAAKTYLAYLDNPLYGDRIRIVIQPGAKGGSGIVDKGNATRAYWLSGDSIYNQFPVRSNAMKALLPHYQQALISWHQGYASASDGATKTEHSNAQDTLFNYFRSGVINGVTSTTPIEIGNLGGAWTASGNAHVGINESINETPQRLSNIGVTDLSDFTNQAYDLFVFGSGDDIHFNPPYARIFGNRKGATWISIAPQPMNTTYGLLVVARS